ncbi:MAG TPA: hypothetical protein VGN13_12255 [Solirubrobacteraceae bacterium]|jgi:hypothetical protein
MSERWAVLSSADGDAEGMMVEAASGIEAVRKAVSEWELEADPGYRFFAVPFAAKPVEEFEFFLDVRPVSSGEGEQ